MARSDDFSLLKLYKKGHKLSKQHVFVKYSPDYNRKPLNEFDSEVDREWNSRVSANGRIFDAKKFRFHSLEFADSEVHLNLGLTSYKDFLGTNCHETVKWLQDKGEVDYNDCKAYLANPLGIGSLIKTSDGQFVFIRRSSLCAEGPGLLDRPGGHPEPEYMCKILGYDMADLYKVPHSAFTDELFDSVIREIVDEINIPRAELGEPQLFGLVFNRQTAGRPSAEFVVKCYLQASQVKALYSRGDQPEAEESTELLFLPEKILNNLTRHEELWSQLTPSSQGCIIMFQELRLQLKKDLLSKEDLDQIRNPGLHFNSTD